MISLYQTLDTLLSLTVTHTLTELLIKTFLTSSIHQQSHPSKPSNFSTALNRGNLDGLSQSGLVKLPDCQLRENKSDTEVTCLLAELFKVK